MLRLTKKADYSLIALRHLAARRAEQNAEVAVSAKEVADSCGIPLPILSKLLQKLTKSGFLTAEYGTNGGYRLALDPGKISTLEVIRAIDGPIVLANCFTAGAFCGHSDKCTVKRPLRRIHDGIMRLLENVSIRDMLQDEVALTSTEPSGSAPAPESGSSQKPLGHKLVAIDAVRKLEGLSDTPVQNFRDSAKGADAPRKTGTETAKLGRGAQDQACFERLLEESPGLRGSPGRSLNV